MKRRTFIGAMSAGPLLASMPSLGHAADGYRNLLILVELKGGNDGLNTVVPYADARYYTLRPRIAIPRDQVLQLDGKSGLHPALAPLMPLWQARELAVVQGVGYPAANLSHFRSIDIWDTASNSDQFLQDGWLARTFARAPVPRAYAADAVIVGGAELGPLAAGAGSATRAIALTNTEQFLQQAKLAAPAGQTHNAALRHILRVEQDILHAAAGLNANHTFRTVFPQTGFGNSIRTAAQVIASRGGVAVVKVALNGFDTHSNQPAVHQRLLKDLADGLTALKSALMELGLWDSALVMTYAEFGRRPRENQSNGTDHGTANTHFVMGGRVNGGLYGQPIALDRLDGNGNPPFAVDFREMYATVLERWWGVSSANSLGGKFTPVEMLKA